MSTLGTAGAAAPFDHTARRAPAPAGALGAGRGRPHSVYLALALAWAGLVLYGTLLPFELRPGAGPRGAVLPWLVDLLSAPRWFTPTGQASALGVSALASDLAVNLALMLPLGMLLRLHLRKRRWPIAMQLLLPAAGCFALCWCVESMQSQLVGRYAAIQDVLSNSGGAVVGVALGPPLAAGFRVGVFAVYRRCALPLHGARRMMLKLRRSPVVMFMVTGLNLLLIVGWFTAAGGLGEGTPTRALPFEGLFQRSYDVAAVYAGRAMIVYCLVGGLLSLQFMRLRSRRALGVVLLGLALIAFGRQLLERSGAGVDVTESVIAVMAGGLLLTTVWLMGHAVRCSCRRREQIDVPFERRRVPFEYRA